LRKPLLVLAATVFMAPAVLAGTVYFEFTYTGPGVSASGVLTTTPVVPGEYLITGVSGERNGDPITAFLYPTTGAPGSLVYISNGSSVDNLLFVPPLSGPFSDWTGSNDTPSGFVYQTADGEFNPYTTNGLTYEYNLTVGGSDDGIPIQFSAVEESSEPPSLPLIAAGLAALGGLLRRRRHGTACAPAGPGTIEPAVKKFLKILCGPPIR
jgi:MYXO-CTERM domain-containing protein